MTYIDFLPQWYKQDRRRRDLRISRIWLTAIGFCALGVWFGVGNLQLRQAHAQLAHLQQQNHTVRAGLDLLDQLKSEQATLLERCNLAQKLTPSISSVDVLTRLAEFIPSKVAIERLNLISKKASATAQSSDKLTALAARIAADKVLPQASSSQGTQMHLSIVGLAPTQMDVAVLVGRLAGSQDFRDVRLQYCKATTIENRQGCTFEVTLLIQPPSSSLLKNKDATSLEALD